MKRFTFILITLISGLIFSTSVLADCLQGDGCSVPVEGETGENSVSTPPLDLDSNGYASNDEISVNEEAVPPPTYHYANTSAFDVSGARGDFDFCKDALDRCGGMEIPVCSQRYIQCNYAAQGRTN